MSRVSRKSELSPSVTRGGNGIDLGKNSGVDMGEKTQPSMTSGGIGITQEVTSIGGSTLSAGIEIDVTPVDFGVNFNPSEGSVAVSGGAEIPGGILGVSGGIEVDLATGEVIGGSVGAEVGGLGINLSNSKKGGLGIEFTVQIPGTPIELSLGFGFPPEPLSPPGEPPPGEPPPGEPPPGEPPPGEPPPGEPPPPSVECSTGSWVVGGYSDSGIFLSGNAYLDYRLEIIKFLINTYATTSLDEDAAIAHANRRFGVGRWTKINKPIQGYFPHYGFYADGTLGFPTYIGDWYFLSNISGSRPSRRKTYHSYDYKGETSISEYVIKAVWRCTLPYYQRGEGLGFSGLTYGWSYSILEVVGIPSCPPGSSPSPPPSPSPSPSPFPNPPPRKQKKMDTCCRQTLAFLRLIYTRLGLAKFPGQLPNTIIQEIPKEGEEPAEPPQVPIPDLVSLLNWTFERDDERWGQWVVQINVKDSDITKEGDQGKQVKFPNLAESIAEIEGQILSLTANVDALVAITTKNLVESGLGRQEAIKSYLAAKSIIKYMAFKTTEIDVDIPACFTPEAQTIHELVNESTIHFKGIDYTEKETLRDICLDLLQAAAIIRAVHWQKIDTKQDTKKQILNQLRGIAGLANSVKNPIPAGETQPKRTEDFEDFIDAVEDGFRNVAGVADAENPYGRTPDRRPIIRQIGENISQAGGKN